MNVTTEPTISFDEIMTGIGGVGLFAYIGLLFICGIVWLIVAIWVGLDASNREQPGFLWFVLTSLFFPVGLTAWLIVRAFLPAKRA